MLPPAELAAPPDQSRLESRETERLARRRAPALRVELSFVGGISILLTITQAGMGASRMNRAIHNDFQGRRRRSIPEVFRMRLAISSMEHSVVSRHGIA